MDRRDKLQRQVYSAERMMPQKSIGCTVYKGKYLQLQAHMNNKRFVDTNHSALGPDLLVQDESTAGNE